MAWTRVWPTCPAGGSGAGAPSPRLAGEPVRPAKRAGAPGGPRARRHPRPAAAAPAPLAVLAVPRMCYGSMRPGSLQLGVCPVRAVVGAELGWHPARVSGPAVPLPA